jgi:hypothetical protein
MSRNLTLDELYRGIQLHLNTLTIQDFMDDFKDTDNIICIGVDGNHNVYGINLGEKNNKHKKTTMIECKKDVPPYPHPSSGKFPIVGFKHPEERVFIETMIHSPNPKKILLLKPDWFNSGEVPETKIFRLVEEPPAHKYIDSRILRKEAWTDNPHCEQTEPTPVFDLVPLSVEELNELFPDVSRREEPIRQAEVSRREEPIRQAEVARREEPLRQAEVSRREEPLRQAEVARPLKSLEELTNKMVLNEARGFDGPGPKTVSQFLSICEQGNTGCYVMLDHLIRLIGINMGAKPNRHRWSPNPSFSRIIEHDSLTPWKGRIINKEEIQIPGTREYLSTTLIGLPASKYKVAPHYMDADGFGNLSKHERILLIRPDWSDSKIVPGTKIFRLVEQPPAQGKILMIDDIGRVMAIEQVLTSRFPDQKPPIRRAFELVPMSLEELNDIFGEKKRGGKTKRRKKNRKSRKNKRV